MKKVTYTGSSKILIRLCEAVNDLIDGGLGSIGLGDLTDVDLDNLDDGDILVYDEAEDEWKNVPQSSGSDVTITPTLESGVKIADFEIDGTSGALYAPKGGNEDIFSIFDICSVNMQYASGSITDHNFAFSVNDYANDWSTFVVAYNNTAIDITDFNKLKFTINVTEQADYGAFWVNVSQTKYIWATNSWPGIYNDTDALIKITESGTYEVDVSEYTGDYYIYIGVTTGKASVTHSQGCDNTLNGKIVGTVTSFEGVTVGGGSTVVANPSSPATDTLHKVEIDGTVYDIEGGGTGSGSETLYTGTARVNTITLSKPYTDYDYILITAQVVSGGYTYKHTELHKTEIMAGARIGITDDSSYLLYDVTNATTLTFALSGGSAYFISDITGIKVRGGSGGNTYTETVLFNTRTSIPNEITLSDDISNYDQLIIGMVGTGGNATVQYVVDVETFKEKFPYVSGASGYNIPHFLTNVYDTSYSRIICGSADNKLYAYEGNNLEDWAYVIGIKYKGGSGAGGGVPADIEPGTETTTSTATFSATKGKMYMFSTVYHSGTFTGAEIIWGDVNYKYIDSGLGRVCCIIRATDDTITYTNQFGNGHIFYEFDIKQGSEVINDTVPKVTGLVYAQFSTEFETVKDGVYLIIGLAQSTSTTITGGEVILSSVLAPSAPNVNMIVRATGEKIGYSVGGYYIRLSITPDVFINGSGGGGGSTVSITPTLSSGTKIADFEIDGTSGSIYAPDGSSRTDELFSIFDTCLKDSHCPSASLSGGVFSFNINDTEDFWSQSATIFNGTAIDITDYDKVRLTVNITDQSDYGAFWITFSQIKYTWNDTTWPHCYTNVDSALKMTTSGTYTVDVSNLTGDYYIYVGGTTGKDTVAHGGCTNSHSGKIIGTMSVFEGIVSGESGTTVIANPTGTPTDELHTIQIGEDIYEIVGGSGGSGDVETLFTSSSFVSTINLTKDLFDYDLITFELSDGNGYTRGVSFAPSELAVGQVIGFDNNYGYIWNSITSGTVLTNVSRSNFFVASVVGMKMGAGGGGSSYSETELWSGAATMSAITLSDSILNYDAIYVECMFNSEAIMCNTIDKSTFKEYLGSEYISFTSHANQYFGISPAATDTNFTFFGSGVNGCVRVIGIKYGSGGGSGSQEDYSNTERVIGTWIDGRPIYQVTIGDATAPITTEDLTALNIDFTIDIEGIFGDSASGLSQCTYTTNTSSTLVITAGYITYGRNTKQLTVSHPYGYCYCITLKYVKPAS